MATPNILHVGTDICQRIPVMRTGSFTVFQSEDSVPAILKAFAGGDPFSVVTFEADVSAPSEDIVSVVRSLTTAPFVLFENASIYYDESVFDMVIPALSHPTRWLKQLHDAVEATHEQREPSRQL